MNSVRSLLARITVVVAIATATAAGAFQGPYASIVTGYGGFPLDLDVRWPDGAPPPGGWPVVFFGHGAGGDKTSSAGNASAFADDGYVTLAWTNRTVASAPTPPVFAADLVALKNWLVNDFQAEAGVTVPVDPARFGITGSSLGGYTSWSGGLLTNAFATIVPLNWGFHFFTEGITQNGSIERVTGGPLASLFPTPYDAASLQAAFEAAFDSSMAAFPDVAIPVMAQVAFLDARTGATYALHDYQALSAAPARFVYLGTGGHGTPDTDDMYRFDLRRRWLAHYLKDEANGVEAEAPIQLALVGTNEHLGYSAWPPPGSATTTVWLRTGSVLAPTAPAGVEPSDSIVNDPGTFTWDDATPNFPPGTIRTNLPKQTLAWQTAPLTDEALLIGQPAVRLELAGTGSHYQVNVHLYDAQDGGDPLLLAYGTATLAASPATIDVALSLTGRRVPAGHRLRLEVTNRDDEDLDYTNGFQPGGDALRYIPFFELSTTTVFHDAVRPSSATIPLVGRDTLPLSGVVCDPAPRGGCRKPTVAGVSPLTVKNLSPDTKDSVAWKWSKGASTPFDALGDPLADDGFAFCVYDATASTLLLEARVPAGGPCDGRPCWKQLGSATKPKGFRYVDKDLTPDGVKKLQLLAGDDGKAKAVLSGKGDLLGASGHFPTVPLPLPLVAQLQTTNTCFEATYDAAKVNEGGVFKAK